MGLAVQIQLQQLGGIVTACCWVVVASGIFLAETARG